MRGERRDVIRTLFRLYYRSAGQSIEVPHTSMREFAYLPFGRNVMIRHLSFGSDEELRRFLVSTAPLHVYYSTAYYKNPSSQDMDGKGWQGADLVFDIDADHIETDSCKYLSDGMTLRCLDDAKAEALKLVDVLTNELGFKDGDVKIVFSGSRGFHAHVESDVVRGLTQDERREIIDYLLAKGFDVEKFIVGKRALVSPALPGIGGRIGRALVAIYGDDSKRVTLRALRRAGPELERRLSVCIDEIVTLDVKRLIRVPNSIHGKTGLRAAVLSRQDLEGSIEQIVAKAVPDVFRKGYLTVEMERDVKSVLVAPEYSDLRKGSVVKLPTYVGIYLAQQGLAKVVELE